MNNKDKLKQYLKIADEIKEVARLVIDKVSILIRNQNQKLNWRERVIFGLVRKFFLTFECLAEDAKKEKGEAQHHLKTLVECFLYYHWVSQENNDTNAKLLLAKGCSGKISFFNKNPNYPDSKKYCKFWKKILNNLIYDIEENWKKFKKKSLEKLVENSNVDEYYRRVYKRACEPSHISDLLEYIPMPDGPITLKQPNTSKLQSIVAIDYALHITCSLLQDASDFYELGLDKKVSALKMELAKTRDDSLAGAASVSDK